MAIRNVNLGGSTDWQDTGSTTLNGAINDSVTTITLTSSASFKTAGIVKIDNELISYTGKSGANLTGCTRGAYATTNVSHLNGATVTEKEVLFSDDLNDTFDAVADKLKSLSVFWLNTDLYDVYDNFNSYSTASFTTGTYWTVAVSGTGAACDIVESTNAGGDTKELRLSANIDNASTKSITVNSKSLANDKHTFARVYSALKAPRNITTTFEMSIDNSNWYSIATTIPSDVANAYSSMTGASEILIVAKGSSVYDVYIGGRKYGADLNVADLEIYFRLTCDNSSGEHPAQTAYAYIDDVRQAKTATS